MNVLIVLGGSAALADLLVHEAELADIIITADSGAAHLAAAGLLPHVLVGDMDSIDASLLRQLESSGVDIVKAIAEKDETDGWLAMDEAISRGATEIVMLGALGGRVDHLLGNLMLLVRAEKRDVRAVIKDEGCEITTVSGAAEIKGRAGDTVSLLPIGEGVSVSYLDGLQYGTQEPLPLPIDAPVGVSNVLTADVAHVVVAGRAYIVKIIS